MGGPSRSEGGGARARGRPRGGGRARSGGRGRDGRGPRGGGRARGSGSAGRRGAGGESVVFCPYRAETTLEWPDPAGDRLAGRGLGVCNQPPVRRANRTTNQKNAGDRAIRPGPLRSGPTKIVPSHLNSRGRTRLTAEIDGNRARADQNSSDRTIFVGAIRRRAAGPPGLVRGDLARRVRGDRTPRPALGRARPRRAPNSRPPDELTRPRPASPRGPRRRPGPNG